ncbi:MAG: SDR family oxidoreductase [Zoogloeaceae bacterium]|nr:SDR family oxidoreductase [Zoogloeaceae bacterium]
MFGLSGKTVLVTGASSGIGAATAFACANAGARLVISGRDVSRLDAVFSSLPGEGHRVLPADLTDTGAAQQLAADCGALDGVVHCAGMPGQIPMKAVKDAFMHDVMNCNYHAPIMLTCRLLSRQAIRKGGSIIFLSSIAALTGTVGVGPYSASKAALIGALRPLALECVRRHIRANALCPGLVKTPFLSQGMWEDPDFFEEKNKRYPLGIGKPEDIAFACVYLLSDAGVHITGQLINIDGGGEF